MLPSIRLPDLEPLTIYRTLALLGGILLFVAGLVNPTDASIVPIARYITISAQLAFVVLTFVSAWVRRHVGWMALVMSLTVVLYLCAMVYGMNADSDSFIASVVGLLICGIVLHRVVLVVVFLAIAAAMHIATAYAVPAPEIEPLALSINIVFYSLFIGAMLCVRLKAQEQRRRTESIMDAMFEQSTDALVYGAPGTGQLKRANRQAERLFETRDLAQIERLIREAYMADHTRDVLDGPVGSVVDQANPGEICELSTATGRVFWGSLALRWLDVPGQQLVLARITDISELMEREAALASAKESAEEAAQSRSQFLANMSHEIRTPMNGVIGMTSLLLKTPLNDEQQRYVDIVRSSGESLLTIINEILDFSKLEAGQVHLEHQRFDVEEVTIEALQIMAPQASAKGLELALRMKPGQHRFFVGDAQRLRQVLVNLLSNAVKFTSEGDIVVAVDVPPGGAEARELRFEVQDTGIGIEPATAHRLFEPFVQADASTTRKYGGTGLGLSISKSLVEIMGGHMSVVSDLGLGSSFRFNVVADAAPARPLAEGLGLRGKRVAIVQSHALTAEVLGEILRDVGMEVALYSRAEELFDGYRAGAWDVLIADQHGGSLDGAELVATLGQLGSRPPPAVLLAPLQSQDCQDVDHVAVLRKPVRPSALLRPLQQVLGLEQDADAAQSETASALPGFQGVSVLVAEDNPVNQQVVRQMLDNLHVTANIVDDGFAAVEAAKRQDYDLVLLDVQMPGKDGMQTAREIRALRGTSTYIAAMTASVMAADRAACLNAGMDDFIPKPVRVEDLERRLLTVMARGKGDTRN